MTEPPRPPGADSSPDPANDPTTPFTPAPPASTSGAGSPPPGGTTPPGYTPAPDYPPPGFAQPPGHSQPPGHGQAPGYDQPPGYAPPPGFGQAPPPGAPGYGAPGYGAPGYGAPGYGTPGYGAGGYGAPAGPLTGDDRTWSLLAHFSGALGAFLSFGPLGFVGPLIVYLVKGQQSPTVRAQAVQALNFQLLWSIIAFVALFIGWCIFFIPNFIIFAVQVIVGIIAGVKAANGEPYRYPMSREFIK